MNPLDNQHFREGYEGAIEGAPLGSIQNKLLDQSAYLWVENKLKEIRSRVNSLQTELKEGMEQKREVFREYEKNLGKYKLLISKRSMAEKAVEYSKNRIEALELEKKEERSPYSLFAGILYFLAGFAFLAGDLIISHEIVAYALNIRNTVEAWAFAVGLASLSVLLKPAYERLVEQPYLEGKGKRVYAFFQGGLLILCTITLFVLGWFRYEAYKTDKLKAGINQEIKSLELAVDPDSMVDSSALLSQMDAKLQAYNQLNMDLVNSPLAMFSFVLTGLLFALAGAICLGIAFPILQVYWKRAFQFNKKIKAERRSIRKNAAYVDKTNEEFYALEASVAILKEELLAFRTAKEIRHEQDLVLAEIKDLEVKLFEKYEGAITEHVQDAYARGEVTVDNLDAEELSKLRRKKVNRSVTYTGKPLFEQLRELAAGLS